MILDGDNTSILPPDYTTVANAPRPPRYWTHERPSVPLTYTFRNCGDNTVILTPPDLPVTGTSAPPPSYSISVSLNLTPFIPLSYLTRVHRIARPPSVERDLLGEFELAINHNRAVLTIGDVSTRLSNVLKKMGHSYRQWTWRLESISLRWDCRTTLEDGTTLCLCYSADASQSQLATFVPPPVDGSPPLPNAELTVFPDGHEFFDHILISALIIERKLTMF